MLWQYRCFQTLSHICCHSPALLRVHCERIKVRAGVLASIIPYAIFLYTACCACISPGEPEFLLLPTCQLVWPSPCHSVGHHYVPQKNLQKTEATKVQDTIFFSQYDPLWLALGYTAKKVVPCCAMIWQHSSYEACHPAFHSIAICTGKKWCRAVQCRTGPLFWHNKCQYKQRHHTSFQNA